MQIHIPEPAKIGVDLGAAGVTLLSLFDTIPKVTAVLSLLWVVVRLYETNTVQKLIEAGKKLIQTLNEKGKSGE